MRGRRFEYPAPEQLTVVIRAAGERTERACAQLFAEQLPEGRGPTVIHEKPFSRAVLRSFEIGIDAGRPWLIAVDADILPLPDTVERAREICGKMAPDAFVATPLFLCRTVGGFAMRGLHCYRASLLPRALALAPELAANLRPESRFHDAMRALGHAREVYAKALGLHEHEQHFRHVYVKSLLRARKDEHAATIRARLERTAADDPDSLVALWGFEDAADGGPVEYDWDARYERFETRMAAAGLTERGPLGVEEARGLALERILAHDFGADRETEPWIRAMHGFSGGAAGFIEAVRRPPLFTPAPARAGAA